jgi:hypothetical protein
MCHWGFFYKTNGEEGKRISIILGKVMLPKLLWTMFLLVRVGIPSLKKEWKLFLARQAWSYCILVFVCGPFVAREANVEEEYP